MSKEFALPSQPGNSGKSLVTDGTNPSWGTPGTGTVAVATDGMTILGDGTSGNPLHSGLSTYGRVSFTGAVDGTNLIYTVPSGVTVLQIENGTQFQSPGAIWSQSGTTVTFTAGNAPVPIPGDSIGLYMYGSTATVAAQAIGSQSTWIGWALSSAYRMRNIVLDANSIIITANVDYPDGTTGAYASQVRNATFKCVDAYTVTNTTLGRTLTQPAVTRNSNGVITSQPAIIIS